MEYQARNLAPNVHEAIAAVAEALLQKRDPFGRLPMRTQANERVFKMLISCSKVPHGGLDVVDQCSMLLQVVLGKTPRSVVDLAVAALWLAPAAACAAGWADMLGRL